MLDKVKPYFTSPLTVTKVGERTWRVQRSFSYISKDGDIIIVPKGFETDFASVPRPFWNIFPPDGHYTQAAVLHDFVYNKRFVGNRSRSKCDGLFLEAMKCLKVGKIERWTIYSAVRVGGWVAWKKKKP